MMKTILKEMHITFFTNIKTINFNDNLGSIFYIMQINKRTLEILKNFAAINKSINITPGGVIRTMSPNKTILASATIAENFEKEFAIYDLNRFLAVLSLFKNADITLNSHYANIADGSTSIKYFYCEKSMIIIPPEKDIVFPPQVLAEFDLSEEQFSKLMKAVYILQSPEIAIIGKDGVLSVNSYDSDNPNSDDYSVVIGSTENNFTSIFRRDNILLMNADYKVTVGKGISKFASSDVTYHIPNEKISKW